MLKGDVAAGITTAAVLIPQGMAYAALMQLPIMVGLYASLVPLITYAVFGPSRIVIAGPASLVSIVTVTAIQNMAGGDPSVYLSFVLAVAILTGLITIAAAIGRLGFIEHFISDPVVTGFAAAAGLTIMVSQVATVFGYSIKLEAQPWVMAVNVVDGIGAFVWPSCVIGVLGVTVIVIGQRLVPRIPWALVVVVGATGFVALFGLDDGTVPIVGSVPDTFPTPQLPSVSASQVVSLLPATLSVTLIVVVQSYAAARYFGRKTHDRVRVNSELAGIGISNVACGFFGAYPITAGFGLTAIAFLSRAKTQLTSLIAAGCVAATIGFLTPLFRPMPNAVLGAVVIVSAIGLIDSPGIRRVARVKRADFVLLIVAFAATLGFGVTWGIMIAVMASLIDVIRRSAFPKVSFLGRVRGTRVYRDVDDVEDVETIPGLALVRPNAPLYYANSDWFVDRVLQIEHSLGDSMWGLIIDGRSVTELDSTAAEILVEIARDCCLRGVVVAVSTMYPVAMDVLRNTEFFDIIGEENAFLNNADAVAALLTRAAPDWLPDREKYLQS